MASAASSIRSNSGTIASYAKMLSQQTQSAPDMVISIAGHAEGKTYTTHDALTGRADIVAPQSSRFDEIQITLEGTVKTYAVSVTPSTAVSKTHAIHRFLKMAMPFSESDYPQPRIAEVGRTYSFPFNFVVPDQLLPRSCSHDCTADHVKEAHLQLPPSMGDAEVTKKDDLAPEMASVQYAIKVKVVRTRESDGKQIVLTEGTKKVNIIPAVAVAPPLSTGSDDQYVLSKTKSLRKGMFSGKLGKVTISAAQPGAIVLSSPNSLSTMMGATTAVMVQLRFDPRDESYQPPRLGGLNTKIKASTFFAIRPTSSLPTHSNSHSQLETARGVYDTSVSLSSRCVGSVSWTKQRLDLANIRRNSASSGSSSSDDSDHAETSDSRPDTPYYTTTILVPVTLPSSKTWIPTFHNCISSRIYILDISLSIHTPGTGVPASKISLHVPVQIAAAGNRTGRSALTAAEEVAELAAADEHLRPRVLEVPSENLIENSVLTQRERPEQPPSYEDFGGAPARQIMGRC